MSLILEALKKSDQERRRDRGPDLQTIHRPPPRAAAPRRAPWLLGAALLAAVNLAAAALWWQWQRQPSGAAPAAEVPAPQPAATATATAASASAAAPSAPAAQPAAAPAPATAQPASARSAPAVRQPAAPSIRPPSIQELWELPDPVRSALPAMTFSFHVYSENPERRTIIINDRRMRQGDSIGEGVVLEEITQDGVILALTRHRVHIPVLSGW